MAMSDTMLRVEMIVREFTDLLAPARKKYDADLSYIAEAYGIDIVFDAEFPDEGGSLDKLVVDRLKGVVTEPWTLSISTEPNPNGTVMYKLRAVPYPCDEARVELHRCSFAGNGFACQNVEPEKPGYNYGPEEGPPFMCKDHICNCQSKNDDIIPDITSCEMCRSRCCEGCGFGCECPW
jgi:hypothetical protein